MSSLPRKFVRPTSPTGENEDSQSAATRLVKELRAKIETGVDIASLLEPSSLDSIIDALRHKEALDDRKFLLEHILIFLSRLPPGTAFTQDLNNKVISFLWNDLGHPPATFISNKYAWRTADGSYNNPNIPDLGKSNTPYARSVQQVHPLPVNMMPDSGLVFDTLLRREKFVKHPAGCSSLMFSFAALVIHTCFRTDHTDWTINKTSSYVDLSPLYGNDQAEQDKVRLKNGGGLLHPDSFAEDRLLLLPPGVCVLLVLFNRNHNYIARKLLDINERGTWVDPSTLTGDKLLKQDEELFQTARLINCGWFAGVVFSDYFATILGLARLGSSWNLDPFEEIRKQDHSFIERGMGNAVSVEFNCLYRWHATTSVENEAWIKKSWDQFFGDMPFDKVTPRDFAVAAAKIQAMEPTPEHWTFGGLTRQDDGSFRDEDLARLLKDATASPAACFGARGTPAIMRLNEIMGIEQSRKWGVCSLNDFRKYLGLKPYASFLEWNPDPDVANAASKLYYGDINNLELYVGLQAEATKPVIDGAGLCPGYTVSRAILADAISLTRGDRFFTTDMTPYNYTAWGIKDFQRDTENPGFGSLLGPLFLRTLPGQYTADSVYTWFPLLTPDAMSGFTEKLGIQQRYDFKRPSEAPPVTVVEDYADVRGILQDVHRFRPVYADRLGAVVKGQGFFIATDQDELGFEQDELIKTQLLGPKLSKLDNLAEHFRIHTSEALATASYCLREKTTKTVDVSEVLRGVPVRWVADDVTALPLNVYGAGSYSTESLYEMLGDIYNFLFLEEDPAHSLELEDRVKSHTDELLGHIKSALRMSGGIGGRLSLSSLVETFASLLSGNGLGGPARKPAHQLMEKLMQTGKPVDELANGLLSTAVGSTVELSQALINMVNLYLLPENAGHRKKIESLVTKSDQRSSDLLEGYAREALRLDPPFAGVYRESRQTHARLFLSIGNANKNAKVFTDPTNIDPTRPAEIYLQGDGMNRCLGVDFEYKVMAQVLRVIFSLKNLRRAPGPAGTLKRFRYSVNGTEHYQYLDNSQNPQPWATSMILQYDA